MSRKIRYGMVGGGRGAFIGGVHRIAAAMDQQIELVCGAFSSDPEKSRASGADFFLPPERCYGTFQDMIQGGGEAAGRPAHGFHLHRHAQPRAFPARQASPWKTASTS